MKKETIRYAFLWLLVALFAACTNEVELPDEAKEVLARSEYAQRFNSIWKILNENYVLLDGWDGDFDQIRVDYILKMDSVATDSAFVARMYDFFNVLHEKNIYFSVRRYSYVTNKVCKVNQAQEAGEYGCHPGYCASGNDNKYGGPFVMNMVLRYDEDSVSRSYALFLADEYTYTELPENFDEQMDEILEAPVQGIVLDMRSVMTCAVAEKLLSYFYASGSVCSYEYCSRSTKQTKHSDYTLWASKYIRGNGRLADYPVAIIVDSLTHCEYAWLAHILAERDNVVLVGTSELNGATWRQSATYYDEDRLDYPYLLIRTKHQKLEDPMALNIVVDWEGYNGYSPLKEDKCLVAALDYIDSYNNNRP